MNEERFLLVGSKRLKPDKFAKTMSPLTLQLR